MTIKRKQLRADNNQLGRTGRIPSDAKTRRTLVNGSVIRVKYSRMGWGVQDGGQTIMAILMEILARVNVATDLE